jgi:hypothetical protein
LGITRRGHLRNKRTGDQLTETNIVEDIEKYRLESRNRLEEVEDYPSGKLIISQKQKKNC